MFCAKIFIFDKDEEYFVTGLEAANAMRPKNHIRVLVQKDMNPYIRSNPSTQAIEGYIGDIWNIIDDHYKFKHTLELGVEYDDGMAMLEKGEADIMLANGIAQEYHINIYHTQPYFMNWYHLYLKTPEALPSSLSYVNTFSPKLWFFSGCLFLMLTVSVWLTIKLLHNINISEPSVSLPSCFLGVLSGFINQGFDLGLRSHSARIQVFSALIFGVVLYSAMNAVLFSQMALFEISFPFTSLKNIAERHTHSLCVRTNSFVYSNFTDENRVILPEWKGIVNNNNCLDINDQTNISKIICKDNIIILENRVIMSSILSSGMCEISNHNQRLFLRGNVIMLRKRVRHLKEKPISTMLNRLNILGILNQLENRYIRAGVNRDNNQHHGYKQCTMAHVSGILLMYGVMVILSLVLLAIEVFWKYWLDTDLLY